MSDTPRPGATGDDHATGAPSPRRGRWRFACLGCLGLLLLFCIGGGLYAWYLVEGLASAEPLELPPATVTPEEREDLRERAAGWADTLQRGEPVALTLAEDELNALAALAVEEDPHLVAAHVTLDDKALRLQLSVQPDLQEQQFFNVVYEGGVVVADGHLVLTSDRFTLGRHEVSAGLLAGLLGLTAGTPQELLQQALDEVRRREGLVITDLHLKDSHLHIEGRRER